MAYEPSYYTPKEYEGVVFTPIAYEASNTAYDPSRKRMDPLASRMPPFGALVYHIFQKLDYSDMLQKTMGCPVWFFTSHDAKLTWRGRRRLPTTNTAPPRRRLGGRRPICKILTMPKRRKHPITGRRRRRRGEESCGVVEVVKRQTISGQPRRRRKEEDEVRWHPKRRYGDEPIPSSLSTLRPPGGTNLKILNIQKCGNNKDGLGSCISVYNHAFAFPLTVEVPATERGNGG
ncbi:hypothetical protein LXL04_008943 [Taraxacum kok-saghyz]